MSHFTVLVITPKGTTEANAEDAAERLLDPYSENLAVEPYKVYEGEDDVTRMAEHYGADSSDLRNLIPHMQDWNGRPGYVDEQGLYSFSTYNPKSKWDWFTVGGRWSGALTKDGRDIFPLTDLKSGWSVFAIITPDGEWNAKGEMGWFAIVSNENQSWDALKYEIASAFPEHIGVLVDCHI